MSTACFFCLRARGKQRNTVQHVDVRKRDAHLPINTSSILNSRDPNTKDENEKNYLIRIGGFS